MDPLIEQPDQSSVFTSMIKISIRLHLNIMQLTLKADNLSFSRQKIIGRSRRTNLGLSLTVTSIQEPKSLRHAVTKYKVVCFDAFHSSQQFFSHVVISHVMSCQSSFWFEPVLKQHIKCLAQGHNTMTLSTMGIEL